MPPRVNHASLTHRIRRATLALVAALLSAGIPSIADAQVATPGVAAVRGTLRSRADLEAAAVAAQDAGRGMEAAAIRARLAEGDFVVGDRIVVSLHLDTLVHDTLVVREGAMLRIPSLVDVPLRGVLRSELEPRVTQELSRVLRSPRVEAHGLVRMAVLGEVTRPGYYYVTADMLVSDAIMTAGGPTASAQPERSEVRRAGATLLDRDRVRAAIQTGTTLDALGLRAGDELVVGRRRDRMGNLQVVTAVLGIVGTAITAATLLSR